jgi:hypothetical protein
VLLVVVDRAGDEGLLLVEVGVEVEVVPAEAAGERG